MEKVELLAPCGGMEQLKAAIEAGADAVYIGGRLFNARIGAGNFSDEELKEAIDYAHLRGVKVYITLNTLIFDDELEEALYYGRQMHRYSADALIVQDLGLAKLIKENLPDMELHLSTQGTIYNPSGAEIAKELGFSRVVAAREMTLEEIGKMSAVCETEVFVHGAICICYSGQCQMSRSLGGRSGNRGRCAQPCRLPYRDDSGKTGYYLSPRDLSYLDNIPALIKAGVKSFKIEGRMKSPEYVAEVTGIYRKYIDIYYEGKKFFVEGGDKERLRQIFSRGEFTEGFLQGIPRNFLVDEAPKHNGILIGHVVSRGKRKTLNVQLSEKLDMGDGIEIRGGEIGKRRISGNIVTFIRKLQKNTYIIGDISGDVRPGDFIYRISEKKQMVEAKKLIQSEARKIPVDMKFFAMVGKMPSLSVKYGKHKVQVTGKEEIQEAINLPVTEERVKTQLKKTGKSSFFAGNIDIKLLGDCAIPVSYINNMRRNALEKLKEEITKEREIFEIDASHPELEEVLSRNETRDIEFPAITKGEFDAVIAKNIAKGEFDNKRILLNNLGWIKELKERGAKLFAGPGFNITNGAAAMAVKELGVIPVAESRELQEEPKALMVTEYPLREGKITDNKGRVFEIKKSLDKTYIRRI